MSIHFSISRFILGLLNQNKRSIFILFQNNLNFIFIIKWLKFNCFYLYVELRLPEYSQRVDYKYKYYRLMQDNELKLEEYDGLLQDREKNLRLYQAMKNGDYSHLRLNQKNEASILAHQSTSDIFK